MQVKINQEIREYTETIFFGLSPRQFFFRFSGCSSGGFVLSSAEQAWYGDGFLKSFAGVCIEGGRPGVERDDGAVRCKENRETYR